MIFCKSGRLWAVLRSVTEGVDARDSVGACDSKTAHDNTFFPSLLSAGDCGELAVEGGFGDCKMASLGVGGLA